MAHSNEKTFINQQLTDPTPYPEQATAIKQMWRIFAAGSDSVLELRAIWPKGVGDSKPPKFKHFRATSYQSVDALKAAFEQVRCPRV